MTMLKALLDSLEGVDDVGWLNPALESGSAKPGRP